MRRREARRLLDARSADGERAIVRSVALAARDVVRASYPADMASSRQRKVTEELNEREDAHVGEDHETQNREPIIEGIRRSTIASDRQHGSAPAS
jgi:hypothetical protein